MLNPELGERDDVRSGIKMMQVMMGNFNLNLDIDVFQPLDKKIIAFEFWSKQAIWKMDRLSYLLSCKDSNIYIPAV